MYSSAEQGRTGERESNASDNNKKALTKKVSHLHSSLTGFMSYKSSCDTYNSDQEKKNATGRRNYWDVAHIPNQQVRKLFLLTFGPEKSGMLGKKADEQIAYSTDRGKIGMTFSKVQVDAHLEQMERDLEVTGFILMRSQWRSPMLFWHTPQTQSRRLTTNWLWRIGVKVYRKSLF